MILLQCIMILLLILLLKNYLDTDTAYQDTFTRKYRDTDTDAKHH